MSAPKAAALSRSIEPVAGMVFEAHSTDYQTPAALEALVQDHFAILKVGPGVTFALREALWALSDIAMELDLMPEASLKDTVLEAMQRDPRHWKGYYLDPERQDFDLQFSLSDRIRYYWTAPAVARACTQLLERLAAAGIPLTLISQYLPAAVRRDPRGPAEQRAARAGAGRRRAGAAPLRARVQPADARRRAAIDRGREWTILEYPQAELETAGGIWTAREISQQPALWPKIERLIAREAGALRAFLDPLLRAARSAHRVDRRRQLAFVGECLAPALIRRTDLRVDAVATTDLVGSPDSWLEPTVPTLLVSFARSGNSPESVAALKLAEQVRAGLSPSDLHLQSRGRAVPAGQRMRNAHVVLLPEETNDRGFAMTSSFSGMLLAAALAFDLLPEDRPAALARWAAHVLEAGLAVDRAPRRVRASSGWCTWAAGSSRVWRARRPQDARTQRRPHRRGGRNAAGLSPWTEDHRQRQDPGGDVPLQ